MKRLVLCAIAVASLFPVTCGAAHAFSLSAEWIEVGEEELTMHIYDGKDSPVLLGRAMIMRNTKTGHEQFLFVLRESDEVIASVQKEGGGRFNDKGELVARLEPDGPSGAFVEFLPFNKEGNAFAAVLYNGAGRELARQAHTNEFHRIVSEDEPMDDLQCVSVGSARTTQGTWKEFTCGPRISKMSWFYPFDAKEPLVKMWSENASSRYGDEEHSFLALRLRNKVWAEKEALCGERLIWEKFERPGRGVIGFEVKLSDEEGHALVRRVYKGSSFTQ